MKINNCNISSNNNHRGFSILELTVAVFIISVILVAIASNMTKSAKALWEAKTRFYAINMTQNCIEDFNYASRKFTWDDFYKDNSTEFSKLCSRPLDNTNGQMDYLCCGSDCTGIDTGGSVPCVTAGNRGDFNLDITFDGQPMAGSRYYYDIATDTVFNFAIHKEKGLAKYSQRKLDSSGNAYVFDDTASRQTVVLVMTVTWAKYGGKSGEKNNYQVVKQYLEVY